MEDQLVELAGFLAESLDRGAKPADEIASGRVTGHPDLLRLGGSDNCGGELAGVAGPGIPSRLDRSR